MDKFYLDFESCSTPQKVSLSRISAVLRMCVEQRRRRSRVYSHRRLDGECLRSFFTAQPGSPSQSACVPTLLASTAPCSGSPEHGRVLPRRVLPASRPSLTSSFPVSRPCSYCFSGCGCSTPLSPGWASCLQNPFSDVPPASRDGRSLALPDVHSARVLVLNPAEE